MGHSSSRPEVTRSQVEDLTHNLQHMSEKVDKWLPLIALARNGTAVLMFVGAVAMVVAAGTATVFAYGGKLAGALLTVCFVLHLLSFILREVILIRPISRLLQQFDKTSPTFMGTIKVPKLRGDGLYSFLLLLEAVSIVAGFVTLEGAEWAPPLIAGVPLLLGASFFCRKIIKDKNDFNLKDACQMGARILQNLLNANQDARV